MAKQGLRFTDFHSNGSMGTPTRAALLTGRYQQRLRTKFEGPLSGKSDYLDVGPLEAVTMAEVLEQRGFATGMFGKWHLGYQPPFLPTRQGFSRIEARVASLRADQVRCMWNRYKAWEAEMVL